MTKTGKILLGCGGVIVIVVIVLGGVVFYLMNKDFEKSSKLLQEGIKRDQNAGMEFGKTIDQPGCINEGFRLSRLTSQEREVTIFTFVNSCLQSAKPVQDFCVGVPPHSYPADTNWRAEECRKAGLDALKTECTSVFEAKQSFCQPEGTK
ncbi:MAG TPA: hypothetical protein VGO43_03475 [Pyrinomonadaceae bacterium]|jgi:hypothetical protein|nr:hypothetical protein [Pyrinomonadaceae bacterium]